MQHDNNRVLILAALIIAIALFAAGRRPSRAKKSQGVTDFDEPTNKQIVVPTWPFLLLVVGFFSVFFWFYRRVPAKRGQPAAATSMEWGIILLLPVLVVVLMAALIALQFLRHYDFGVRRAQKRADAGDLEGAIDDLREQIEDKGATQDRANVLGILLLQAKKWDEAAALFRKAEELGAIKGVCRANLGVALLEGGKPDEALPVLQDAAQLNRQMPVLDYLVALHSCLALADLGRWHEAREQFRRAEAIAPGLSRSQRQATQIQVDKCRTRLAEA